MEEESFRFLTDKLRTQYGETALQTILAGFGAKRRSSLRVNTLKTTVDAAQAALDKGGIPTERVGWYSAALVLPCGAESRVRTLPLYENGEIYLQSLSSMLPPLTLDVKTGESLLDMAAAPGGKTTQVAAMSGNLVNITACERNGARAERLKYNLQRQGAKRVTVLLADARTLSDDFAFDSVLLDAPCSGSGTVTPDDTKAAFHDRFLKKLTATQLALLQKALRLLKKEKSMTYSTCSLFREENEDVVAAALKSARCEIVPLSPDAFPGAKFLPNGLPGTLTVTPDEYYEGFFLAKIRKHG